MGQTAAWKGALEVGGFPIHVRLFPRVKSLSGFGFRTLAASNGQPIKQFMKDSEGNEVSSDETRKGIDIGGGEFVALNQDQLDLMGKLEKSTLVEPRAFVPLDSIDLSVNLMSYSVVHDKDVAGAENPMKQLLNYLRVERVAYVTQLAMRSGARDSIIVLYSTEEGKGKAVAVPFVDQVWPEVGEGYEVDDEIGEKMSALIGAHYDDLMVPFDHESFESEWASRREMAKNLAIGNADTDEVEVDEAPVPATNDLMAVLEDAVKEAKPKKAKAKKAPAKAKSKAKVKA